MKKLVFSLLFFISFLGFSQKIYMSSSSSQGIKDFIKENNLPVVDFVYQNTFVTNNKYDEAKLIQTINKLYPNKNQTGIAVLDWEGVTFDNLVKSTGASKDATTQFQQAIQKAKSLRPNVKWSFYGLPTRNFWNPDQKWKNKNLDLITLFSNFDFIAPSIYIFYPFNEVNQSIQNKYIDSSIQLANEIGREIRKPVYPIVNHRFHPSNKIYGNQLVSKELFSYYISRIASNQIDIVIWWQSEEYNYNISKNNKTFKTDYSQKINKNQSQQQMLNGYYKYLKN